MVRFDGEEFSDYLSLGTHCGVAVPVCGMCALLYNWNARIEVRLWHSNPKYETTRNRKQHTEREIHTLENSMSESEPHKQHTQ